MITVYLDQTDPDRPVVRRHKGNVYLGNNAVCVERGSWNHGEVWHKVYAVFNDKTTPPTFVQASNMTASESLTLAGKHLKLMPRTYIDLNGSIVRTEDGQIIVKSS